jgi:hypothetical protein
MCCQKIVDILHWKKIDDIINNEVTEFDEDEKLSDEDLSNFKYAPIVSCDVERSFSKYISMFRDDGMSFHFENLKFIFITSCWYLFNNNNLI